MGITENDEQDRASRRFHLSCRVGKIRQSHTHALTGAQIENESVILEPREGDERTAFLTTWLPGADNDSEIVVDLDPPIDVRGRVSLQRPDRRFPGYYLFVMSQCLKDRLVSRVGSDIALTTLPQDDHEAQTKDY